MRFPSDLAFGETASFVSNVKANGSNYDCSGFTLNFLYRGPSDTAEKTQACTWVTQNVGRFRLKFDADDLDEAGDWTGVFVLTDGSDVVHDRAGRVNFQVRPEL